MSTESVDKMIALFEDVLTTLAVADRGDLSVPNMGFYDGAIMALGSTFPFVVNEFESIYGKGNSGVDRALASHQGVRGSMLMTGEGSGARYALSGGKELSFEERKLAKVRMGDLLPSKFSPLCDRIIECRSVLIHDDGVARTFEANHYYHYRDRAQWFVVRPEKTLHGSVIGFSMAVINSVISRLCWSVCIKLAPDFPSLSLFTDPTGIHEFFKLRSIPEGSARRRALVHWVSRHWRQNRNDPELESYVREHLRGDRMFSWGGMSGEVRIPESDQDRVAIAVKARAEMKVQGLDRRLRELKF